MRRLLRVGLVGLGIAVTGSMGFSGQGELAPFTETLPGSVVKIRMMPVPGGTVQTKNGPVTVKPFWIAETETPWEAFDAFLQSGPASPAYDQREYPADAIARPSKSYILPDLGWGHHGFPAINISSTSAEMFCRWLASVSKKKYRFPTEAEWELACREGNTGDWKVSKEQVEAQAWYSGNAGGVTHPVGKKAPNKLGLYDMLGNVGEWATDSAGKPVLCGGTFRDGVEGMSPTNRKYWSPKWQETDPQIPKSRWWLADGPFVGLRVVCVP
ncbi:MAG TPA: SUMF1/EgtB/PvdO family nonheme iron enzyme [Fimbriimonas sp.]|nr:SUMF1/EgtB/PvdO family nonheme iron enzyme [Fimbriimonas sp.]